MTNEKILQRMEEEISLRGLSQCTRSEYMGKVRILIKYFAPKPLLEVTIDELRDFLLYQKNELKRMPGTVNIYNSTIRFVFGSVLDRFINYQQLPRVKNVRSLPDIMSQEEIQALFKACDDGTKYGIRDKAMLMTIYASGLRVSEVANLKGADIYASTGKIKVCCGKGQKDRFTLLSKLHLEILTQLWRTFKPHSKEGFLFTTRSHTNISARAIENVFTKRMRLAGLVNKPYSPHTLRHNFATDMLNAGFNIFTIKELLGHNHIQSTCFYLHLVDFEQGIESPLDRLLKKPKDGGNHD